MIEVRGICTQRNASKNNISYRFRSVDEIRRAVYEATERRRGQKPIHTGNRAISRLNPTTKEVASCMEHQQELYRKTSGIRVREEMLSVTMDELESGREKEQIGKIADSFSDYYFYKGFQSAYGVYEFNDDDRGKGYDILYAINTVNFMDGSKYRRNANGYLEEVNRAAKTVAAQVKGQDMPENDFFDIRSLEYYQ